MIVEVGSRWLRAGFEGDSSPICVVGFGKEEGRRVGDYRGWISGRGSSTATQCAKNVEEWLDDHQLWSMDIRGVDIGLFEDKIERAFREIYNKYLLTGPGSSRLVLVLPSVVPYPLLSALLSTLFHRWRYPSITLLPSAAMAAVAAGVRSALVIDIGWEETVVTGIYEYREVRTKRSTRAMKLLMQRMGRFLSRLSRQHDIPADEQQRGERISVTFEQCEEIMARMAWCKLRRPVSRNDDGETSILEESKVSIPITNGQTTAFTDVPFSQLSNVVEDSFFPGNAELRDWDDEDMPLDILAYNALLSLSSDVRGSCMSRLIFIGGGSNIPGIRQRIINDIDCVIKRYGWNAPRGKVIDKMVEQRRNLVRSESGTQSPSTSQDGILPEAESNFIDEKLRRADKDSKPYVHGVIREVESLGPWTGASLTASLKVRGLVEIEREKFLQHGLAGASREIDARATVERRSGYGAGMVRPGGERSSWTLGEWG